ncbi:hypothetical protein DICVIV_13779 [Dictyocaulus viviparus]|uniref:Uncharacterized protein n=1 Tax=Dictyocaulus viviparus TaxID=29172 RepID=A0A0D8X961_DICVI|nr:hypothetical protein DICVIV_13779 [Dictyocaulus viviparus]
MRLATIAFDGLILMSVLCLGVSLMVFVINAEMLESKYLIGVKNTFEKYYGYSFYLACLALLLLVFTALGAVLMTTFTFFSPKMLADTGGNYSSSENQYNGGTNHVNTSRRTKPELYAQDSVSFIDPGLLRSITPVLQSTPQISLQHGDYISPIRSPNGEFQLTTRHFYSY